MIALIHTIDIVIVIPFLQFSQDWLMFESQFEFLCGGSKFRFLVVAQLCSRSGVTDDSDIRSCWAARSAALSEATPRRPPPAPRRRYMTSIVCCHDML